MTYFIAAILGGAAANQLDNAMKLFEQGWELIARYIAGVLTIMLFFALMLKRMNPAATRDGLLAFVGASSGVGLGVVGARCLKDLVDNRAR
jgi:hypothetical protein